MESEDFYPLENAIVVGRVDPNVDGPKVRGWIAIEDVHPCITKGYQSASFDDELKF